MDSYVPPSSARWLEFIIESQHMTHDNIHPRQYRLLTKRVKRTLKKYPYLANVRGILGRTLMHHCYNFHSIMYQLLLAGGNPNILDIFGWGVLDYAIVNLANNNILSLLLSHGAKFGKYNRGGHAIAATHINSRVAILLIKHGLIEFDTRWMYPILSRVVWERGPVDLLYQMMVGCDKLGCNLCMYVDGISLCEHLWYDSYNNLNYITDIHNLGGVFPMRLIHNHPNMHTRHPNYYNQIINLLYLYI
jgi:hypothetical protein